MSDFVYLRCKSCKAVNRLPQEKLSNNPVCGRCKAPLEFPRTPIRGTALNFEEEVLEWPGISLVEFWATWCGACRLISPILDQLAEEMAGRLKVVKIDVDEEAHLAGHFHIKATPTLILYQNGGKVNEIAGALNKDQMREWIDLSVKG